MCTTSPTELCQTTVFPLEEKDAEHDGDIGLSAVFESSSKVRTWYRDEDGDHYGTENLSRRSAAQPRGYVVSKTDCNDLDADIHLWTKELLQGVGSYLWRYHTFCRWSAGPLVWQCKLESAAVTHSTDMASNNFFSHTGSDQSSVSTRVTATGYVWSTVGENIAAGYSSVGSVMNGWINSPGHCANMMNPNFQDFGSARVNNSSSQYGVYWTQVFGKSR